MVAACLTPINVCVERVLEKQSDIRKIWISGIIFYKKEALKADHHLT